MDYCFVIQPFDKGKFDKRYNDVFRPALKEAGVDAYRVDKDPSVSIPIDTIEERINNARLCLADITTDNPNVWYEVGFAIANSKEVILVCSDERTTPYPFDIKHRNILNYKTESESDFKILKDAIISRTKAITIKPITVTPKFNLNLSSSGLTYQEIVVLASILSNQNTPDDAVSAWNIKQEMNKSGLNEIAFSLAIRKLLKSSMLEITYDHDFNNEVYACYKITDDGNQWIIENEEKFPITSEVSPILVDDSDIPF